MNRALEGQDLLPVFGSSFTGDGSARCSEWTKTKAPCARVATVPADGRHGPLCKQHAAMLRKGRR